MKAGSENRKKMMTAAGLGTIAIFCVAYAYNSVFGGAPNPAATPPTQPAAASSSTSSTGNTSSTSARTTSSRSASIGPANGPGAIPGVAAQKLTATSSSLDPTLDEAAMLRTENLVYSGSGRNIFSATYTPPAALPTIPKLNISARPQAQNLVPVQTGPPPPPPINLKFFGTITRAGGQRQAWLLQGDEIYQASSGDIVARKYKIGIITPTSVQVTDLQNNNTQNLPYQAQ